MKSWYAIRALKSGAQVLIYDEIGAHGVTARGFLAELAALPDAEPIELRLNSPGGSVFDAVAIYNALKRHGGTITVWIDGLAASAASYVAMAGDEIVMPENAFLMIHDPSGMVIGTAADMREMADTLDKIAGSMIKGYSARSGRAEEEIAALMAAETWFDAEAALAAGLVTRIAEPVRIAASFDLARFRQVPPALAKALAAPASVAGGCAAPDEASPDEGRIGSRQGSPGIGPDIGAGDREDDPARAQDSPACPFRPQGAEPPPSPIDLAAIRDEAMAHARAVVELCRLAGQPQMAGSLLERKLSLEEVRRALLAAGAGTGPEISPHHSQPGRNPATHPWGEVIARTFKLKG